MVKIHDDETTTECTTSENKESIVSHLDHDGNDNDDDSDEDIEIDISDDDDDSVEQLKVEPSSSTPHENSLNLQSLQDSTSVDMSSTEMSSASSEYDSTLDSDDENLASMLDDDDIEDNDSENDDTHDECYVLDTPAKPDSVSTLGNATSRHPDHDMSDSTLSYTEQEFYSTRFIIVDDDDDDYNDDNNNNKDTRKNHKKDPPALKRKGTELEIVDETDDIIEEEIVEEEIVEIVEKDDMGSVVIEIEEDDHEDKKQEKSPNNQISPSIEDAASASSLAVTTKDLIHQWENMATEDEEENEIERLIETSVETDDDDMFQQSMDWGDSCGDLAFNDLSLNDALNFLQTKSADPTEEVERVDTHEDPPETSETKQTMHDAMLPTPTREDQRVEAEIAKEGNEPYRDDNKKTLEEIKINSSIQEIPESSKIKSTIHVEESPIASHHAEDPPDNKSTTNVVLEESKKAEEAKVASSDRKFREDPPEDPPESKPIMMVSQEPSPLSHQEEKKDETNAGINDHQTLLKEQGKKSTDKMDVHDVVESLNEPKGISVESPLSTPVQKKIFLGREDELRKLEAGFSIVDTIDDVDSTPPKFVWISGNAGIGKTILCNHYLDIFVPDCIITCRGSFTENLTSEKPFSAIISCFSDLMDRLFEKNGYRERIRDSLGEDVSLLALLIPSLSSLLEEEDDDDDDDDDDEEAKVSKRLSKNEDLLHRFERLKVSLRDLLMIICGDQSIIFFLDDLQWIDGPSMQILEFILATGGLKNFHLLGSHRRMKMSHPFCKWKAKLQLQFSTDIALEGLDTNLSEALVKYYLCSEEDASVVDNYSDSFESIASSLHKKYGGNPFFLTHLIYFLRTKNALRVENNQWILDTISSAPTTPTQLITQRIAMLITEEDLMLQSAALLGPRIFHIDVLNVAFSVLSKSEQKTENTMLLLASLEKQGFILKISNGVYTFIHDIIRKVASSRLPNEKSRIHSLLTLELLRQTIKTDEEMLQIMIVDHFGKGHTNIHDEDQKIALLKHTLELSDWWMMRGAYAPPILMLHSSMGAIDSTKQWNELYSASLKMHLAFSRCLFCVGDIDKAKSFLNVVIANAKSPRDKVGAFELLIQIYHFKGQYELARNCILKALDQIWNDNVSTVNAEQKLMQVRKLIHTVSDADMLVMKKMSHKKASTKMPFLMLLVEVSIGCQDYRLQDLAALRMIELTIQYGSLSTGFTALVLALCGMCLGRRNLYGEANRYGHLAEMMSELESSYGRRAITLHHYYIRHWRNPVRDSPDTLKEVCKQSIESKDLNNLSFQMSAYLSTLFIAGQTLDTGDGLFEEYAKKCDNNVVPEVWRVSIPFGAIKKLTGKESNIFCDIKSGAEATQYGFFFQMIVAVFMQNLNKANKILKKLSVRPEGIWIPYGAFMEGLVLVYFARTCIRKEKANYKMKASKLIDVLAAWAKKGMTHSAYMANILSVEFKIAIEKDFTAKKARILYDAAIDSASEAPAIAALASERAGLYFLSIKKSKMASKYLSRAYQLYERWGACAKLDQLKSSHKKHLKEDMEPSRPPLRKTSSERLMFSEPLSKTPNPGLRPGMQRGPSARLGGHTVPNGIDPGPRPAMQRGPSGRLLVQTVPNGIDPGARPVFQRGPSGRLLVQTAPNGIVHSPGTMQTAGFDNSNIALRGRRPSLLVASTGVSTTTAGAIPAAIESDKKAGKKIRYMRREQSAAVLSSAPQRQPVRMASLSGPPATLLNGRQNQPIRTHSLPGVVLADGTIANPRMHMAKQKSGLLSELKEDLHPKEFLKAMGVGKKKKKSKSIDSFLNEGGASHATLQLSAEPLSIEPKPAKTSFWSKLTKPKAPSDKVASLKTNEDQTGDKPKKKKKKKDDLSDSNEKIKTNESDTKKTKKKSLKKKDDCTASLDQSSDSLPNGTKTTTRPKKKKSDVKIDKKEVKETGKKKAIKANA